METKLTNSLSFLTPNSHHSNTLNDFNSHFNHLNSLLSTPKPHLTKTHKSSTKSLNFSSTSLSLDINIQNQEKPSSNTSTEVYSFLNNLSVLEKALTGGAAGGLSGAFTHVCLHPLDTIKTKLQTKGASQLYNGTLDAVVKTFQTKGVVEFYRGVSAVIVGSTASSAVYFGTCEFGKSILSKIKQFPPVLIPPTAGAMGNIVSSGIMVPRELITQRMQAGAKGWFWEVLLTILEKDGFFGLYKGYSATLLRNLPAGVLSYSSFEYAKSAVLRRTRKASLEGYESVCIGAMAGVVSACLTTPLDVIKTRLMTQSCGINGGIGSVVKHILMEEGFVGFSRGMGPRVLHGAGFSAIGYFAFETARFMILNEYMKRKEKQRVVSDFDSGEKRLADN